MQTSILDAAAITPTRRQLQMEATKLLYLNGISADGRPFNEARTARVNDAIPAGAFKWEPPK
jgi:hypothetical protein